MKRFVAALLCVVLVAPMQAEEREKETPKAQKKHKLFDRKLILAGLTMLAAEIADNETTLAVMRRNRNAREMNPFYGSRPSRVRIYAIGTALTGLAFLTAVALRQQALRRGNEKSKRWLIPVVVNDATRAFAAWHNSRVPASHPRLIPLCPAAGAGCR